MSKYSDDTPKVLYAVFEGVMPDGTYSGHATYTGLGKSPEELAETDRSNVRFLEMKYSGIRNVARVTDWTETVLPLADDDTTEES